MSRFAIAGGGIAGLTTALALARIGAEEVVVVEAAPALSDIGAGVQLSPNATRILRNLGVLDAVMASAVRPRHVRIRRGRDGAELAALPLDEMADRRYGAPFLVAHRGDLQAVLLRAVEAAPQIKLVTGTRVAAIAPAPQGVTVRLVDGDNVEAAALIGADGLYSRVRRYVAPQEATEPRRAGRTAWRALVAVADAPPFARECNSNLWLGSGAHLVHYPVRGGALVNVVAITTDRVASAAAAAPDDWTAQGDAARLSDAFGAWCPQARALLDAAPDWRVWPLFDRAPLDTWSRGAVTLAGDAAHPMLPFLAQGAAQAIEDAQAIAEALAGTADAVAALRTYDARRRDRAARVQRESARQAAIYHLPAPASLARDMAFRLLGPARMLRRYDWLYGA